MAHYDFIILGGGVSGLGFAKRVSDKGKSVLVLEKEDVVGGLSRSLHHEGYYLDFCAHRFHTKNKQLLDELMNLEGLKWHTHVKKSRIFMFGKYLKYPFEIEQLLRAMPLSKSIPAVFSFGWTTLTRRWKDKSKNRSYKDWFLYLYGPKLYEVMCLPYTSKIWHVDPGELSADWADQRFQTEDLKKLMARAIKKVLSLNFTSYSLEDDELAPDGGMFYYPERGIQEMADAMARAVEKNGGKIACGARIQSVSRQDRSVGYFHRGNAEVATYGTMISTIPLHAMYELQEKKDADVEQALGSLKYMDIAFVYLFADKPRISNDHWLYYPDKEIIYNRAVEFSNWSEKMCPKGKTSVCFDITTFPGDEVDRMSDDALAERVISDVERIGYLKRSEIDSHLVVRVPYAYPFYDLDYKEKLQRIAAHLEDDHAFLLGRTGVFRYNNSDNSIEMGFELADNLVGEGEKKSIVDYKIKQVSL